MTETTDRRADATRQQILQAAAFQFARRPYNLVSLDDILGEAEVTKGAMYFHFRSKHALALAVIDEQNSRGRAAARQMTARKLSGLETLIDMSYLTAVRDISDDFARAGLNLLESIGRHNKLQANVLAPWITAYTAFIERAIAEGDIREALDPAEIGRLVVSLYIGIRQTGNLDEPREFLADLESSWLLVLRGVGNPQRLDYLTEFVKRRTALALSRMDIHQDTPPTGR
jgi:TetR/AcrR family transcriptional regulator, transcriptional repressor for nem operon